MLVGKKREEIIQLYNTEECTIGLTYQSFFLFYFSVYFYTVSDMTLKL